MKKFKLPAADLELTGKRIFRLAKPWIVEIPAPDGMRGAKRIMIVFPQGMTTDFASIPRAFQTIIGSPIDSAYVMEALLHDFLYATELFPRADCDWLFLSALAENGKCGWIRRNTMWAAVKAGGGIVWAHHDKRAVRVLKDKVSLALV